MNLVGFSIIKINNIDDMERKILIDFIKTNLKKTTIDEVKLAFDFAIMKETDAEIRHFQTFSAAYISEVVNAFVKRKKQIHEVLEKKKPEENKPMNPQDLSGYREKLFEGLLKFIEEKNEIPKVFNWSDAFRQAEILGLINDTVEIKRSFFKKVKEDMVREENGGNDKINIERFIARNFTDNELISECRKRRLIDYLKTLLK